MTLGFLEKLTNTPDSIRPPDLGALRRNRVNESAILDAIYICVGFNIINRIADAMDFKIPPKYVFERGTKFMRKFGYKMMSGSGLGNNGRHPSVRMKENASLRSGQSVIDPYNSMMRRLRDTVFAGPGTLDAALRKAAGAGAEIVGALGPYVRKVAQRDYEGIDRNIVDLRLEGYSDDQIFEATVSAALGAGVHRLEIALAALRESLANQAP